MDIDLRTDPTARDGHWIATVPAHQPLRIAHLGCQRIRSSVSKLAEIPSQCAHDCEEKYGKRWRTRLTATDAVASACRAALVQSGLSGVVFIDTMRGGSDYWRPGKLMTVAAEQLRLSGYAATYERDDALCPGRQLLDRFLDKSTPMSFADYAQAYCDQLIGEDKTALIAAVGLTLSALARGRLPVFYCTDPFVPGYRDGQVSGSAVIPYAHRHYPTDDAGFYRDRGCHRVVLVEEICRYFAERGHEAQVLALDTNVGEVQIG